MNKYGESVAAEAAVAAQPCQVRQRPSACSRRRATRVAWLIWTAASRLDASEFMTPPEMYAFALPSLGQPRIIALKAQEGRRDRPPCWGGVAGSRNPPHVITL